MILDIYKNRKYNINKKDSTNTLNPFEKEFLESVKELKIQNTRDVILYVYNNNPDTNHISNLINTINDLLIDYKKNNLTYIVMFYTSLDPQTQRGVDTYNTPDETIKDGIYSRASCFYFKFVYDNFVMSEIDNKDFVNILYKNIEKSNETVIYEYMETEYKKSILTNE